jgi:Ca-activated chloride channel family protein
MQRRHYNRHAFSFAPGLQSGLLCLLLSAGVANSVQAGWFKNPEQEAAQKYEHAEYGEAAEAFSDTYRRGVALFRAGRYTDAEEA